MVTTTITDGSFSGTVTTVQTKDGSSVKNQKLAQNNHLRMELDSKLDQVWLEEELFMLLKTSEENNTD